ncbi:MAG: NUDIX hydrolase [Candidatus Saccharimonadales bacterium]
MSEVWVEHCDNKSVGVIVENEYSDVALLKRARFPVGMAFPSGHIDNHGSPEQTAVDEAREELGLVLAISGLRQTVIQGRHVNNPCRRPGGGHHEWWVFETSEFEGELQPSADEAKSAGWYSRAELQDLADRTRAFQADQIPQTDWEASPGLEEVWLDFLTELRYVE